MEVTGKYLLIPTKKVSEEVDDVLGTQDVLCGASNYQNVFSGGCCKGVESMVYDMLDKAYVGEYQFE